MTSGRIGSFGPVVFEASLGYVKTFERLSERRRARFATHDVLSGDQKLQFITLELAEADLEMTFHHAFCTPDDELEALRGVLAGHQAHELVIGGKNFGQFVLEELSQVIDQADNHGRTRLAQASLRLREYR
ncbi:conserved hypothetical protein [Desulfarculus baarsii DSM 2075]|uniref:Uncharacterized protein n=1 Tax=Desulfarculus baarsii (strain ATCC 33931 / DSM 2075 / LMG 7858 / VKM B-1802 / 2st14) TaxID=644282 RepID=E1QHA1_DESB2|nr:phage tail protein [Desulfarculus baarsii]ADK84944.1 conserved hypothetical protein [Desulfarculus baarsii DSM 2075]